MAVTPSDHADLHAGVTITVTIDKIRSKKGVIVVRLTDDPAMFPAARRSFIAPVGDGLFVATFRRLKPNEYAVNAFHDENENGRFDSTADGREGFGYSNGVIGAPDFAASGVKVAGDTKLTVSLNYP